jgi:hypothetical protein
LLEKQNGRLEKVTKEELIYEAAPEIILLYICIDALPEISLNRQCFSPYLQKPVPRLA